MTRANRIDPDRSQPSQGHRWLVRIVASALPFAGLVLFEFALRAAGYGPTLDLFVPADRPGYMMTNPDVALRYFSRVGRTPVPPYDVFLESKPENGYRIFMMGGSTAAGWPYPAHASPSRILEARLAEAFPNREIEVINIGIAAVNSFTLLDLTAEVIEAQPDAVLIYAGHNEYYGALGAASVETLGNSRWVVRASLALLESRTVRLVRDALTGVAEWRRNDAGRASYERARPTLMSRVVRENVPYRSPAYRTGEHNFRKNLDAVVRRLSQAGVRVLVSELVSNIRDMPPFVSTPDGERRAARDVFDHARSLEAAGRIEEAREAYTRAKDLDALRFRAPEDFNAIIHEVADRHGAPVVGMKAAFESAAPDGLPGDTLFLEHLHPNTDGYFLMADTFLEAMRAHAFIGADWNAARVRPGDEFGRTWPVTALDREIGRLAVMDLMDYPPFRRVDDPGDRYRTFEPQSPVEEFAFLVTQGDLDFVSAHEQLADLYERAGESGRARLEREAIRAASPYPAP